MTPEAGGARSRRPGKTDSPSRRDRRRVRGRTGRTTGTATAGPQDRSQGRRRHRRGRGRGKGGYDQQQPQQPQRNYPSPRPTNGTYPSGRREDGSLDPFELFCAYHLGITADGRYRQQNIHDLSRRFNCSPAEIKQALADYELDPKTLINSDFDMSMAQLDIMVAPEGVDRRELARPWYEEFRRAHPNVRDWQKELEEDARATPRFSATAIPRTKAESNSGQAIARFR
ncbi:MAG: hypothetical protein M5R36_03910 [Deltaproteobacteria bacterium]|nr:hypothetical protein [Deltaproteobacteria bacterium]